LPGIVLIQGDTVCGWRSELFDAWTSKPGVHAVDQDGHVFVAAGGVRREAARLVMVDGLRPADAARQAGTTPQTVNSALVSCRRGIALAQIVAGTSDH